MKLLRIELRRYRSIRDESIDFGDLNVFIGANASGKSTILDALRFLHEGVVARDFHAPMFSRGGFLNLAWKGETAHQIDLEARFKKDDKTFEWRVRLVREQGFDFGVHEYVSESRPGSPPTHLLSSESGSGWWWSGEEGRRVEVRQDPTSCTLAAASVDASFPARGIAEFVRGWGFFDPNPFLLRRDWAGIDSNRFDTYGRNLGAKLYALRESSPQTLKLIRSATESMVGLPSSIELREAEDRFYFVQYEPDLEYPVNQMGVSSGTLRILALMTAILGEPDSSLLGIEEPENYVHPTALADFIKYVSDFGDRKQFMLTTHSPLLLNFLNDPASVCIVRRDGHKGTKVTREKNPEGVRAALDASGFGLGEFYETRGFGS